MDDDAPPISQWEPIDHPLVSYIAIHDDDNFAGIAQVNIHSRIEFEVHQALLPELGWKKRIEIAKAFFELLRAAGCKRVLGKVVISNRYIMKFNSAIGMEMFGVDEQSFMRNGRLEDQAYFGLSL